MSEETTTTSVPEYDTLVQAMADARGKVKDAGKAAVAALFRHFFAKHPDVTAIGWTQYTPYFNDGDACEFSVHGFTWTTKAGVDFAEADSTYEDDESEAGWKGTYGHKGSTREREISEAVSGLARAADDDVFEAAFGDHVQVIAVPDGFHVSEYSHD